MNKMHTKGHYPTFSSSFANEPIFYLAGYTIPLLDSVFLEEYPFISDASIG
jgi:hypothetical protein